MVCPGLLEDTAPLKAVFPYRTVLLVAEMADSERPHPVSEVWVVVEVVDWELER